MGKRCVVVVFLSLIFGLTACGENKPFVSAFDRQAVSATETGGSITDQEPSRGPDSEDDVFGPGAPDTEAGEPKVSLFDKILQNSDVSEVALTNAFEFYDENHRKIKNKDWITIFDIGQHSGNRRMYVINMNTGDVKAIHTAHGKKSDTNHDGVATRFSNSSGSNKSSLGFMLTAETYSGKHGYSMRLDGLESRNSRVRRRAIVVHGANYVNPNWGKMGRSLGCPAVSWGNRDWVINTIKNGSLFYIFHEDYDS